MTFYRRYGKRAFDAISAAALLVLCSPVLVVAALLVRALIGSPVLFRQARPGEGGTAFVLVKFRTMREGRDAAGQMLPDAQRLVSFGRLLRSLSIDELPELWNVLKGEMSLVGPRPLLTSYLPLYNAEQARRHDVRPGITGWAQVNGRNLQTWEQRLRFDVWYVDHVSLGLDLKILWRTVWAVMRREGISAPGRETMTAFEGTDDADAGAGERLL